MAIKSCGAVQCGHCTCIAGLSMVCNHVGEVALYKVIHEASMLSEIPCTSLPNKWLPATVNKTVSPSQISDTDFRVRMLNKFESAIADPKRIKLSAKTQLTSLTEPSEDIQEEFLCQLGISEAEK